MDFQRLAHLHLDPKRVCPSDSSFEWAVLMQHHRAPTRLLDWSESPYVALYFAVCEEDDADGELWSVPAAAVNKHFGSPAHVTGDDSTIGSYFNPPTADDPELVFVRPLRWSDRMAAQGAWVSICSKVELDHCDLIQLALHKRKMKASATALHIVIPGQIKAAFRKRLHYMNINARTLFPGVDGLGLSVKECADIYCQDLVQADEYFRSTGPEGGVYLGRAASRRSSS